MHFKLELQPARSTAVGLHNNEIMNPESDFSSLKLYRANTESDLNNFKSNNNMDIRSNKEIMDVYEKYSNVKQDSMFDLIKRHESISSGDSDKSPEKQSKTKRSATLKKSGESYLSMGFYSFYIDQPTPTKDVDDGYGSSNMSKINIKKKIEPKNVPDQPKGFFGCFSCFKK